MPMSNRIEMFMSDYSIERLRKLKEKDISFIKLTSAGLPEEKNSCQYNMAFLVSLCHEDTQVLIASNPYKTVCDEEFPKLEVIDKNKYNGDFIEDLTTFRDALGYPWEKQRITSVKILHDHIEWVENSQSNWSIDAHIGIQVHFDTGYKFLIIARDSSVGLLDVYYGKDFSWIQNKKDILSTYFIDEKNVQSIRRNIIPL